MIDAITTEIRSRADFLKGQPLRSIYLGGGTPSLLSEDELEKLFAVIYDAFTLQDQIEITLEANPDDLDKAKIEQLSHSAINRLSIGIQSFRDADLVLMNRAHSSRQAKECLEAVRGKFDNISVDLIYGMPDSTMRDWSNNLAQALYYQPAHLSCYALTVEPKTALSHQVSKGLIKVASEQMVVDQFYYLIDQAALAGYQHYEISNFSLEGQQAIHNTNYWNGVTLLGCRTFSPLI